VQRAVDDSRKSLAIFLDLAERDQSLEARQQAGTAHIKLADLLGHPAFPNLGDRNAALDHYRQALSIYSRLAPVNNPVTRRYLGIIHERIGKMLEVEGRKSEALISYEKSFAIRQAFSLDYPADTNARRDLAIGHEKIGDLLVATGKATQGLKKFQEALRIFESLSTSDPFNANAARAVGIECEKIANTLALAGDAARAKLSYAKAVSVFQRLASSDPMNARVRADLNRVSVATDAAVAARDAATLGGGRHHPQGGNHIHRARSRLGGNRDRLFAAATKPPLTTPAGSQRTGVALYWMALARVSMNDDSAAIQ